MPETLALAEKSAELQQLVKRVANARRVVVVTGAGISVNSGIPDFRSASGVFRQIQAAHGHVVGKGRDLFDASVVFRSGAAAAVFYEWMTQLRRQCAAARPGAAHAFIRQLADRGVLQRSYTQNIDGLERKAGLRVWDPYQKPGSAGHVPWQQAHSVPLHGTMDHLTCQLCASAVPFAALPGGAAAGDACAECLQRSQAREACGRRALAAGKLRPAVVLYEELHPHGEDIARIISHDARSRADVVLVFGTTLKVPGCRQLVRRLAAAPRTTTVVVNNEPVCGRAWDGVVDYQVVGCVDEWCARVQRAWNAQSKITQWATKRTRGAPAAKENAPEPTSRKRRVSDSDSDPEPTSRKRRAPDNNSSLEPARRSARIATRGGPADYQQRQPLSICT
ncbi:NAD-dependent deacetylase hst3 [Coemansia sp. RSA 2610]|nr:NAD-dependent deacetylase hst3 [Coemansia sp. RSA 2610]